MWSRTETVAGKVADIVTEGEAKVESKKGNEIKKNASEEDPAVVIERSGVSCYGRIRLTDTEQCGQKGARVERDVKG